MLKTNLRTLPLFPLNSEAELEETYRGKGIIGMGHHRAGVDTETSPSESITNTIEMTKALCKR